MPEKFAIKIVAISNKWSEMTAFFVRRQKFQVAKNLFVFCVFVFVFCREASGLFNQRPSDLKGHICD